MKRTYVFDFYNMYIPRGKPYKNDEMGIRITPLKFAEEFERHRSSFSKPYYSGGWKTAKCFIKSENEESAKKLALWIEFIYSFVQRRSVFFISWYEYRKGKKHSSSQARFVIPRENRFSELLKGIRTRDNMYTEDLSSFVDVALKTLSESSEQVLNNTLTAIHSYDLSHSETNWEVKFLICWCVLERLANFNYDKLKSKSTLFSKKEKKEIRKHLEEELEKVLKKDRRLSFIKKSISRNFLYEHNTFEKVRIYLESLDLGFDNDKLENILLKLVKVRVGLVHRFYSALLEREANLLFYLQTIMENVIFRLLGVNEIQQTRFILNQYNRGNEL